MAVVTVLDVQAGVYHLSREQSADYFFGFNPNGSAFTLCGDEFTTEYVLEISGKSPDGACCQRCAEILMGLVEERVYKAFGN